MCRRDRSARGPGAAAGQGSKICAGAAAKVDAPAEQLDLLAALPAAPCEDELEAAIARARAFVDQVKARRCCRRCGGDDRLMFVHRRWHVLNREIGRLVRWGVSTVRIRDEISRCDVYCRRCWLAGTWNPTPQMLRCATIVAVDPVAKAPIATGRGRKRVSTAVGERVRKRA